MFAVLYRWRLKPGTEARFREAWSAKKLPSADPEAAAAMGECVEQSLGTPPLEVIDDLLRSSPAE